MEYRTRKTQLFSACGLNCGLCPRYYTVGSSKCTGCAGEGFLQVHPTCGTLSCTQRRGIEHCFECVDFPCKRYVDTEQKDSFVTHKKQLSDMEKAKRNGLPAYEAELKDKIKALVELLNSYDDGRRKSFFCNAVNLLDLQDVKVIMEQISESIDPEAPLKEKAKAAVHMFEETALSRDISLKLRK